MCNNKYSNLLNPRDNKRNIKQNSKQLPTCKFACMFFYFTNKFSSFQNSFQADEFLIIFSHDSRIENSKKEGNAAYINDYSATC